MPRSPEDFLEYGSLHPYDASDEWNELPEHDIEGPGPLPPPAIDWAHAAARGVVQEFMGRSGIDDVLGQLDEELRTEIVSNIAAIIRVAEKRR